VSSVSGLFSITLIESLIGG